MWTCWRTDDNAAIEHELLPLAAGHRVGSAVDPKVGCPDVDAVCVATMCSMQTCLNVVHLGAKADTGERAQFGGAGKPFALATPANHDALGLGYLANVV